ncbi:HpcH/HpaI aldolase/citrate lyase family protein [Methanoregula sp.]|uniref:HpcH/HpaI aldolase family protein n=1 Tax=Methanoregula sp. TaxID=2052170 RepID=UPI0025E8F1B2|nr:aldolase/citrate lyase family protein [Methanoregula sp.]
MNPSLNHRDCIRKKQFSLGCWVQMPDPFSCEIMARAGFDWLAIDLEHGLISLDAAYHLIQVIGNAGVLPLVRLHENDPSTIRRVMDAGAGGIIVPMVNTAEDATRAVDAVKYYPHGQRSFGLGRAHQFGKNFDSYLMSSNDESIVVVQIEHRDALPNLDDILAVPGIDAIIIGPYDLSGSMGFPGKFDDPRFTGKVSEIIQKVRKSPVALGFHIVHPSESDLAMKLQQGFTFIAYGMDTIFLQNLACAAVEEARRLSK